MEGMFQLTRSKTKKAILELFFNTPEKEYYLRQIESITGFSVGNIRREMISLERNGLFLCRMLGKMKLYRLNTSHIIYNEIKAIIQKTIGIKGSLKKIVTEHKDIKIAFIYGSFAKSEESTVSDIDVIVIGDIRPKIIKEGLYEYQVRIGREINSSVYSEEEFLKKIKNKNHFINVLLKGSKIFLKGTEDEFGKFAQIR